MERKQYLTADQLLGYFNKPEDNEEFVLNLKEAREERVEEIMKKQVAPKIIQFTLNPRNK